MATETQRIPFDSPKFRAIPSLDGLRAVSVIIVILLHSESPVLDRIPYNFLFRNGEQAVDVFFLISGFLITHLLLKELGRDGCIDLKRFYFRRTFRIFPPFYVYLLVIALLGLKGIVPFDKWSLLAAFTYIHNYFVWPRDYLLRHTWSLSVEEQFYLLWPLLMAKFTKRMNLGIAGGVVLLSPFVRLAVHYTWPAMRGNIDFMTITRLDPIMMGCFVSLAVELKLWQRLTTSLINPAAATLALGLIVFSTVASYRLHGAYLRSVGYTVETVAMAVVLLFVVFRHESWLGRVLNNPVLRHFGMISYSLYLWQQLFCGPYTRSFPLNVVLIVFCAETSYVLIEKPSFKLRDAMQRKLFAPKY